VAIERDSTMTASSRHSGRGIDVVLCADGPMLIRGAETVADDNGLLHPVHRPVVAVCRCGASTRKPWCDGMHKLLKNS